MKAPSLKPADFAWRCQACDEAMVAANVTLEYLGNQFTTELPRCPQCGLVYIPEDLALGKMAEVEQLLEDK
ncbi:MAG: DNA-binding protein [Pseudomonadota bacterium]